MHTRTFALPLPDSIDHADLVTRRERLLLILAAFFVGVAHVGTTLARRLPPGELWTFAVWLAAALLGTRFLNRRLPHRDPYLFPVVMLLSGWSLALLERVAPVFSGRQTLWLIVAVGMLLLVTALSADLRWLSGYRYLWLGGGLALLAVTIIAGRNPTDLGPRLWLGVEGVFFQPSELLKIILVVFIASYFAEHRLYTLGSGRAAAGEPRSLVWLARFFAPLALMWGISVVILIWQRDLGTAALFFLVFLAMLYLAQGRATLLVGGLGLFAIVGMIAYLAVDLVRLRIDIWLNPWRDPRGDAFQIVQSLMAVASGGLFGQGAGHGSPTYVPVVHSDFIFAAVAEEWGLIGGLAVVMLIAFLVLRGLRLAMLHSGRPFRAYLAAGISLMIGIQSILILGGILKVIPLTGVTLPFLSYGGSSLLISFVMIGLLLVLSAEV